MKMSLNLKMQNNHNMNIKSDRQTGRQTGRQGDRQQDLLLSMGSYGGLLPADETVDDLGLEMARLLSKNLKLSINNSSTAYIWLKLQLLSSSLYSSFSPSPCLLIFHNLARPSYFSEAY